MENNIDIEKEIEKAKTEAKKRLKGFINENQLGYNGLLASQMKEILREKGIEWEPKDESISVD